jgi:hypothetical protein
MPRLAGHIGLRELGPEAGRIDKLRRCDVVWMGVDPEWRKQPAGARLANDDRQLAAGFERRF